MDRNSLTGMVQKSLELVRTDSIKPGFLNGQYFVKSYSNGAPHNVSVIEKNIKCDQHVLDIDIIIIAVMR